MERLITNLDTNLGPVIRDQLDDNFKKLQTGIDGQSDAVNKQIKDMLGDVPLQDQNEVTQARIDANGKQYQTIKTRMDIDQATAETALGEGRDTSTEVKSARVGGTGTVYPTLKQRIDNQEVTMAKNINDKLSEISTVPETFKDLATLQSKYPTGKIGIFVTADTGHKYIWQNNQWQDSGIYQSVGIAKGAVNYDNLDNQAKNLGSTLFDIRQSALNKGYYQYLPFVFEFGSLDSSNGNERDDTQKMVRSGFIRGDGEAWNFFDSLPDLYNYRLLSYKLDGTFNALEFDWKSSNGSTFTSDASLMYRLTLTTKDQSNAVLADANQAVLVSSDKDKAPYNPMDLWGSFDYMINIGAGKQPNIVVEPNKDITVTMPDDDLYYYDNIQTGFTLQSKSSVRGQTFTIKSSQILYWDLQTNTISVAGIDQSRPKHNVLLANNIWGQITNGYFTKFVKDWGLFGHMINVAGNQQPTFENIGVNALVIRITMPNSNLYYFDNTQTGFTLQSPTKYQGNIFTLDNNQLLVWDLDTNTIAVQNVGERRPNHNVLLANNIYGKITNGHFAQYFQMQNHDGYTNAKGHNVTATSQYKKLTSFSLGNTQSMCFIGDNLLTAQGAPSDHSSYNHLILYDENFNKIKDVTHNIGHFNTVDYNEATDTLITGNASDDLEKPLIYLVKDFSKLNDSAVISHDSDSVVKVALFNDQSQAFESNVGICFGETNYIAYVSFSNPSYVKNVGQMGTIGFAKILLGIGDNDLSKTPDGWGNFISDQNGFNGTAKIIQRFYGENLGANQDMTYFDGHIWGTFSRYDTEFYKISLNSGGKFTLEESYMLPNYNEIDGTFNQLESEGAAIWKGNYYLLIYKGAIHAVPINGKQLGTGEVGTRVEFDFKMAQTPHISITATSATTDLFVTQLNQTGFIVKSVNGQVGTFNWEANL